MPLPKICNLVINTEQCVLLPQLCLTLLDPMDCSPPGFSIHGILQARLLEWIAVPSSRRSSQPRDQTYIFYTSTALAGRFFTTSTTGEAQYWTYQYFNILESNDIWQN